MVDSVPLLEVGMRVERLFLHFFDIHFLADKGRAVETQAFQDEMRLATRLAVASADKVLLPAASYFESALCRKIVGELDELVSLGLIMLCGSSTNLDEFIRERQDENFYRKGSVQHSSYRDGLDGKVAPAYHQRYRSATRDIVCHWDAIVFNERLQRMLRDAAGEPIHHTEGRLERVPAELGGLAFIPEHVFEILDLDERSKIERARIRSVINEGYFTSYLQELHAGVVTDLSYLASDFSLPRLGPCLSYTRMVRHLQAIGRLKEFSRCNQKHLIAFGNDPLWRQALVQAVMRVTPPPNQRGPAGPSSEPFSSRAMFHTDPLQRGISSYEVLCVAAASVEFEAIRAHLSAVFGEEGKLVFLDEGKTDYAVRFGDPENGTSWYVTTLSFQGQTEAAHRVERLNHMLDPQLILMVGMCMGMPKRELPAGTVIVPNEVFSFDHQRVTQDGTRYRPHGMRADNSLYRLVRMIDSRGLPYQVVADKGLASASTKIENPEAALVKLIEEAFPDAVAFDMEGAGFYLAGENKMCLWVKAVADQGEAQRDTAAGQADKRKTQAEVTKNAADFAIRVVRAMVSAEPARHG